MNSIEGNDVVEEKPERKKPGPKPKVKEEEVKDAVAEAMANIAKMNDMAARIWEGQSISLPIIERVGRIKAALKDKGFTEFDHLVLPDDKWSRNNGNGYKKFI